MGITTDELRILLRVNGASSYVNQMQQVTRATGGFDNAAGKLISTLARLVSIGAIVRFGKQCNDAASDLQEVANVMNVTFGDSAVIVDRWAKTQAASFGLSETAAKRYIGTYGTMATQFGLTREQAASMGIELAKLTGDVASFYNIDDKFASFKLESIFTGETETLKDLGVVMTQAQLDAYALEKGIGRTTKQMSENEKVALRYSFVMDKLSHTQGDFARTSDGWANSTRTLSLNLENLKIQIGNELLPVAGQGLAAINTGLQMLSPVLVNVAKTVRIYGEAWKNASDQTKGLVKASVSIFAIMAVAPRIIALVRAGIRLLSMEIVTLGSALRATMGILGIVLGAIAFKQLTDQMKELKKASETAESISDIGTSAETSSNAVDDETAKRISDIGTSAETSSNAVDDLSEAMNGLGSATEGLDTFLASFDEVNKVGGNNSLMSNLVNTEDLSNILGVATGLGDIRSMVDQLNATMSEMSMPDLSKGTLLDPAWWRQKWELIKGFFSTFFNGEWKENWNLGFNMIGQWFEEKFPNWSRFWEMAGAQWADTLQPVQAALEKVSGLLDSVWQKFEDSDWSNFWEGIGEDLADKHWEKTRSRGGGHKRYASGGYPNKGSLFIAGETGPELIRNFGSSQTKVVNQFQTNNSTTQEQPIMFQPVIQIDGRKISAVVVDSINNMTRSSGKSPLIELGG